MDYAQNDRYTQGWNKLREIDGSAGEQVIAALAPIAPDFARLLIEFGFGDIYSRPQLDLRAREIATMLRSRRSAARNRSSRCISKRR